MRFAYCRLTEDALRAFGRGHAVVGVVDGLADAVTARVIDILEVVRAIGDLGHPPGGVSAVDQVEYFPRSPTFHAIISGHAVVYIKVDFNVFMPIFRSWFVP